MKVLSVKRIFDNRDTTVQAPKLSWCFSLVMALYVVSRLWYSVPLIIANIRDINSWSVSEFLVNFHGGFVRRGLVGEILHFIIAHTGVDVRWIIVPLCLVCFAMVFALCIKILRRYGLKWWILALPICFAFLDYCLIRKDFLNLLIIVGMLKVYRTARLRDSVKLIWISVLSMLMMLVNEASFFIIMPFLYLLVLRDTTLRVRPIFRYGFVVVTFVTMLLILKSTGDASVSERIHSSWLSLDPTTFSSDRMGQTVEAVGWSPAYAMQFNNSILLVSTKCPDTFSCIVEIVKFALMIALGAYIVLRYPYLACSDTDRRFAVSPTVYDTLVLFQLLSLSPMFLGLSNDFSRVFMYLILTTLFIVYYIPQETLAQIFPKSVERCVVKTNACVTRVIPNNVYTLMIVMCISYVYAPEINVIYGDCAFLKTMLYNILT